MRTTNKVRTNINNNLLRVRTSFTYFTSSLTYLPYLPICIIDTNTSHRPLKWFSGGQSDLQVSSIPKIMITLYLWRSRARTNPRGAAGENQGGAKCRQSCQVILKGQNHKEYVHKWMSLKVTWIFFWCMIALVKWVIEWEVIFFNS